MYYFDLRHNLKSEESGNISKNKSTHSSKSGYHYITRTLHFSKHKNDIEELEYTASANMPSWAKDNPEIFWDASDQYEIKAGRTSTHITIALPKELSKLKRLELSNHLAHEFCGKYKMPFSFAIHSHISSLDERYEQPHLHLLYSERSIFDGIERTPEQFFKRYRPKSPEQGGAKKITADVLKLGRHQINHYRKITEKVINDFLELYAPVKEIEIYGIKLEVENKVSCLSNEDYNQKYGTSLQDVPQIPRHFFHNQDQEIQNKVQDFKKSVKKIREDNLYELYKIEYQLELSKTYAYQNNNTHMFKESKGNNFNF